MGINQIYDVDIDVVNKPFLPVAAGACQYLRRNTARVKCVWGLLPTEFGVWQTSTGFNHMRARARVCVCVCGWVGVGVHRRAVPIRRVDTVSHASSRGYGHRGHVLWQPHHIPVLVWTVSRHSLQRTATQVCADPCNTRALALQRSISSSATPCVPYKACRKAVAREVLCWACRRLKRFAVPAFMIIACVRGFLLNFGVYYATKAALGAPFSWSPAIR